MSYEQQIEELEYEIRYLERRVEELERELEFRPSESNQLDELLKD